MRRSIRKLWCPEYCFFAWVMANNFMESVYQVLLPSTGRNLRRAKQGEKWKETNVLQLEDQSSLKELKRESPADRASNCRSNRGNIKSRKTGFLLTLVCDFTNEEKRVACYRVPIQSLCLTCNLTFIKIHTQQIKQNSASPDTACSRYTKGLLLNW